MALRDFLAVINHVDVQRSSRFVVEIQPPNIPGLGIKPQQQVNLMCQDVQFPGQNMRTATDDLRQAPTRDIAQAVTYGNMNMTFICTPGLPEKLFFESWQKLMFNATTWQAKYYSSYIGQIKLRSLDRTDMVRYGIILYEAYPKIINAQDYSNTAADTMQTLQVEFAFHHWAMDEEVYDNTQRFGSRNEDEDKPKRTTKDGYENMTYEQAQAFLRQNSIATLTAEAGGTAAHANLLSGAQGIDMAAAGTKMSSLFKGFNQAVGSMPMTGRKGIAVAVDAEKVPAQSKINDGAKTPNKDKGTYNYFSGWSKPGGKGGSFKKPGGMDAEEMYGRTPEVTVFGDAVAWQSSPSGKKFGGAKAQAAPLSGCVLSLPVNTSGNKTTAEEPVSTLFCRPQRKRDVATQTFPNGSSGAAKVPTTRAAAWVNPNTGETVSSGSGGNPIKSGFSMLQQMFPGSYSGAVASTTSGVVRQSLGSRSVSASVGSVNIRATISLGGGGGGGLGSLLSPRGLMSGIGIPRFGGIPAVRGAGFQVRSVANKGPSSANHVPEGRSDAGERE